MLLNEGIATVSKESRSPFAVDVLAGMSSPQKWVPHKYLYDRFGFQLFERICASPGYYLFRAGQEILAKAGSEIARLAGPHCLLIEPGSGMSTRVRVLLRTLESPAAYVNVDSSLEMLFRATVNLQLEFPALEVFPICADYSEGIQLSASVSHLGRKRVIFLPGSAIGNFHPDEARMILRILRRLAGDDGLLLIEVDLKKDPAFFKAAYDDPGGVNRDFNLNILTRINREIEGNFQLANFAHSAVYQENIGCMELHIKSLIPQIVKICDRSFSFREGETIHTKNSFKYSLAEFTALARGAELDVRKYWLDSQALFSVFLLSPST
jgi:dimethylhistidine N-methyltransferase